MKISVIMQAYLGDYPGARSNPQYKFVRAVNSFLLQKHPDKELVIVADGCNDAKEIYERLFSSFESIKFIYLARGNTPRTYQVVNNKKHFRGLPREVGRSMTTGELITYADADDIMLPSHLSNLNAGWEHASADKMWSYSTIAIRPKSELAKPTGNDPVNLRLFGYPIDHELYPCHLCPPGLMISAPWLLAHRRQVKARWRDTFDVLDDNGKKIAGQSEDAAFVDELYKESNGSKYDSGTYVICHGKGDKPGTGGWDV